MTTYFPHGVSVKQAKKDAKRAARDLGIPLMKAQDLYAKNVSSMCNDKIPVTWRGLKQWSEARGECLSVFRFISSENEQIKFTIYNSKPVVLLTGWPGSGKSFALMKMAEYQIEQGKHVHFVGFVGDDQKFFKSLHPNELTLYDMQEAWDTRHIHNDHNDSYMIDTMINKINNPMVQSGDVMIIDEVARCYQMGNQVMVDKLISAARAKNLILWLSSQHWEMIALARLMRHCSVYLRMMCGDNEEMPQHLTEYLKNKEMTLNSRGLDCSGLDSHLWHSDFSTLQKIRFNTNERERAIIAEVLRK